MQESGHTEIIPLTCSSAVWDQYPVLSLLESLRCATGVAVVAEGLAAQPVGLCPESPQAHLQERVKADILMAGASFVCWYGRQHFSSHFKVSSDSPHVSKLKITWITGLGKIKFNRPHNGPHYSSDTWMLLTISWTQNLSVFLLFS